MKSLNLNTLFAKLIFFASVLIVACVFMFKGCDEKHGTISTDREKDSLKLVLINQKDSVKMLLTDIKKKDTIRVGIVKYYRVVKTDTIFQVCEPIIKICDSIIVIDSSEIVDLKNVVKLDSGIIENYKKLAVIDSNTIVKLNKEVKKHKRHKHLLTGGLIGLGVIAILK